MSLENQNITKGNVSFEKFKEEILEDYKKVFLSRTCSLIGRKEVLSGKAKFGIFGSGKELAQIAWAKVFQKGDWRSGYYRDQTIMFALKILTPQDFFCGLYAHSNIEEEPLSAGRQMGGHFVTHSLNADGSWKNQMEQYNSGCDISCTAGQMPRWVGLAQASKIYKETPILQEKNKKFTRGGKEICWGTIGNASTSEGHFFEAINACGVLQVPAVISVWDDGYGISVHNKYQTTKESISEVLKGFQRDEKNKGYEILKVKGWDYPNLVSTYAKAEQIAREEHCPVLIHITEITQPLGHSTSGSHERYKSKERLQWEKDFDCNKKFKEWILNFSIVNNEGEILKIATEKELEKIEKEVEKDVKNQKNKAWEIALKPVIQIQKQAIILLKRVGEKSSHKQFVKYITHQLENLPKYSHKNIYSLVRKVLYFSRFDKSLERKKLLAWYQKQRQDTHEKYNSKLYNDLGTGVCEIPYTPPIYDGQFTRSRCENYHSQ